MGGGGGAKKELNFSPTVWHIGQSNDNAKLVTVTRKPAKWTKALNTCPG